jgi:uncharacterized protein
VSDGGLDLEPMIRDAVILSMPFAPLCRPSCLGLCERCGADRNLGECACGPVVEDAWAPLLDLRLDVLDVEETDASGRDRSTR